MSWRLFHARAGRIGGMKTKRDWLRVERCLWVFSFALIANWVIALLVQAWLGGDGWNGYTAEGRYFLANHGRYTETTYAVFQYTRLHSALTWGTIPLIVASSVIAALLREHRK